VRVRDLATDGIVVSCSSSHHWYFRRLIAEQFGPLVQRLCTGLFLLAVRPPASSITRRLSARMRIVVSIDTVARLLNQLQDRLSEIQAKVFDVTSVAEVCSACYCLHC